MRIRSKLAAVRLLCALGLASLSSGAMALTVFTCEPEWAALVGELAPGAKIVSATHARQDPHYIEARPSLIAQLRQADLAVCTGAALEAGWLPLLQERAGNPNVMTGKPGMFFASDQVTLIDKRPEASRADGHVHGEGNPHIHLDPVRLAQVAAALAKRLSEIDPTNSDAYQSRYDTWSTQWRQQMTAWQELAAPLQGKQIIAQHSGFAYLWQWLGIKQVADLEPKPGLPPTPTHLRVLVESAKQLEPIALVQTLYQDSTPIRWLNEQTGVPWLSLPSTVTDDGPTTTLNGLFRTLITDLLNVAQASER